MIDVLELVEALERHEVRCDVCGCSPVVHDPWTDTDRIVARLVGIHKTDDGYGALCETCA